ncbi:MAG: hypothetical protein IKV05_00950 [Bacteroidales bacterium]|nr:hypothetical protein [Bacteroidales bacterium]
MKKTILYLAIAAVAAVSCVKEQNPGVEAPEKNLVPMEFVACSEMTKTVLAEDGMSVEWIEGDQVAIFDGSNMNGDADEGQRFKAQSSGASVVLAGNADPAAEEYYAIYPFSSGHSFNNGVFTTQIKAQQTVKAGSMADDCAVVVGKAEAGSTTMEFKNVCTLIKFPLEVSGVKSLTLIGNNNEVIAGQFNLTWNDGDPKVTANPKPEVAVTLRDAEGADLEIGDYYFTILPTEFTKGFSVILGMNEGTQQIIRRGAVPALSRNQIFRTQNNIPAAAYKAHESNYVKYNDGFALTYSHLTVQKGAEDAYAKYVNDGAPSVSADGVYFVGAESKNAATSTQAFGPLVVAGDEPSKRAPFTLHAVMQPKNGGKFVCADLDITSNRDASDSSTDCFFNQTSGLNSSYDCMLFYDCKISGVGNAFVRMLGDAITMDYFVMEDCDYIVETTYENSYVLYFNGVQSTVNNVVFHNNVFHGKSAALKDFKLAHGYRSKSSTGATINNLKVTNNTVSYAVTKTDGYVFVNKLENMVEVHNNFFVESQLPTSITYYIYPVQCGSSLELNVTGNYFYVTGATKALNNGKLTGTGTKNTPGLLTFNPLVKTWDPANGVFGYEDNLKYYGTFNTAGTEKNVSSTTNGAQRTTTPAAQDRAGYGYSSEELGNY